MDTLGYIEKETHVPANKATAEELVQADQILALHNAGKDNEIPYTAMELVTVLGETTRMDQLRNAPEAFSMNLIGLRVGDVTLLGIPGEPFGRSGMDIRKAPDLELILPSCCSNGYEPSGILTWFSILLRRCYRIRRHSNGIFTCTINIHKHNANVNQISRNLNI